MNKEEQLASLQEIRQIMNKSVRFLSLSGLSGLFAGVYGCLAAYLAYRRVGSLDMSLANAASQQYIIVVALAALILSVLTAFILSKRKASKKGLPIWDKSAKSALINLAIPLFAGGVCCYACIYYQMFAFAFPMSLIFYGLALVSTSPYTFPQLRHLGLVELALGLICLFVPTHSLLFWVVGFGIMHMVYGTGMYLTYDRV